MVEERLDGGERAAPDEHHGREQQMWQATRPMHAVKRIEIRWRDLDGFAHVNNSTYLTYLEEARDEFFTGLLGETVHRVVIRRVELDFLSGLVQEDDHVDVELDLIG